MRKRTEDKNISSRQQGVLEVRQLVTSRESLRKRNVDIGIRGWCPRKLEQSVPQKSRKGHGHCRKQAWGMKLKRVEQVSPWPVSSHHTFHGLIRHRCRHSVVQSPAPTKLTWCCVCAQGDGGTRMVHFILQSSYGSSSAHMYVNSQLNLSKTTAFSQNQSKLPETSAQSSTLWKTAIKRLHCGVMKSLHQKFNHTLSSQLDLFPNWESQGETKNLRGKQLSY